MIKKQCVIIDCVALVFFKSNGGWPSRVKVSFCFWHDMTITMKPVKLRFSYTRDDIDSSCFTTLSQIFLLSLEIIDTV